MRISPPSSLAGPSLRDSTPTRLRALCAIVVWAALFGPSFIGHVAQSLDPLVFTDDSRQQVWPFFAQSEPGFPGDDYIGRYYLRAFFPVGYRAAFEMLARHFDPALTSKAVPYLLLAVTLGLASWTAALLGGWSAAVGSGLVILGSPVFLSRMAGGLPRSFAFPILALAALALARGRFRPLAVAIFLAAGFYPSILLTLLALLGAWLLLPLPLDRGEISSWGLTRRLTTVALTGLLAFAVVVSQVRAGRAYGPKVTVEDLAAYPEAGPGGRYEVGDHPPYPGLAESLVSQLAQTLRVDGRPFLGFGRSWDDRALPGPLGASVWLAAGLALAGALMLARRSATVLRVLLLPIAALFAHVIAARFHPHFHIPERQLAYSTPLVLALLLPAGATALARGALRRIAASRWREAIAAALALIIVLVFVGTIDERRGLTVRATADVDLYEFLATLPPDALLAGWPDESFDNVPYLARRAVLLSRETHQAYHRGYLDEMRRRFRALIAAYFASDDEPLLELRERFGVSHLVIDRRYFIDRDPAYFAPFGRDAWTARAQNPKQRYFVLEGLAQLSVYHRDPWYVLDLRRLHENRTDPGTPHAPRAYFFDGRPPSRTHATGESSERVAPPAASERHSKARAKS